jgi:hypothetical protein
MTRVALVAVMFAAVHFRASADRLSDLQDPNYRVDPNKTANLNALNTFGNKTANVPRSGASIAKPFSVGPAAATHAYTGIQRFNGADQKFATPTSSWASRSAQGFANQGYNVTRFTADKVYRIPAGTDQYANRTALGFGTAMPLPVYEGQGKQTRSLTIVKEKMDRQLSIEEVRELLNRNK